MRSARLVSVCALFGILAVAGCASHRPRPSTEAGSPAYHDLLVSRDQCGAVAPGKVEAKDALRDLETARRILGRGYAGYDSFGKEWETAFASAREELSGMEGREIPTDKFRERLAHGFSFTDDGHLGAWTRSADGKTRQDSAGLHSDAYAGDLLLTRVGATYLTEGGSRLLDCEGAGLPELLKPSLALGRTDVKWLPIRVSQAPPSALSCRFQKNNGAIESAPIRFHRLRLEPRPGPGPVFEVIRRDGIPYVWLRTLTDRHRSELLEFDREAAALRKEPMIILDVRGNGGGSDTYVADWFKRLTGALLDYPRARELRSEVTLQGEVNSATCKGHGPGLDPATRAYLERRRSLALGELEKAEKKDPAGFREWKVVEPLEKGVPSAPFAGRLVVLADAACASACESVVLHARQIPGTLVLGENTAGDFALGEARPYLLPASGIWLNVPATLYESSGAAQVPAEGAGFSPDLWIDSDQVEDIARQVASCLKDPDCSKPLDRALH